jgi:hypothetical protein
MVVGVNIEGKTSPSEFLENCKRIIALEKVLRCSVQPTKLIEILLEICKAKSITIVQLNFQCHLCFQSSYKLEGVIVDLD